ncbi:MAG: alpha/beta fold hydrolase [Planctomycetia bacterium]|nr:alpha/beta fold hydrolase [Planctomycetia bacterium]
MFQILNDRRLWVIIFVGLLVSTFFTIRGLEQRLVFATSSEWARDLPASATELIFTSPETFTRQKNGGPRVFSSKTLNLSAAWFPVEDADRVIVYCHGNAGNISHRFAVAEFFQSLGWPVLLFDYRGYGKSEGTSDSDIGIQIDTYHAIFEAQSLAGTDNVILYGRSLGAFPAIQCAQWASALILDSPFLSLEEMAKSRGLGWVPSWLKKYRFRNEGYFESVECPTLILHGNADEIVPFQHGKRLAELNPEVTEFVEIPGGRHNDSRRKGIALEALKSFISGH